MAEQISKQFDELIDSARGVAQQSEAARRVFEKIEQSLQNLHQASSKGSFNFQLADTYYQLSYGQKSVEDERRYLLIVDQNRRVFPIFATSAAIQVAALAALPEFFSSMTQQNARLRTAIASKLETVSPLLKELDSWLNR